MSSNTSVRLNAGIAALSILKEGIASLLREIHGQTFWEAVTSPATPRPLVHAIMREVYAEIAAYQPDVIEATIAIIGQFPRSVPGKKIRAMLVHQSEEWDHGEMAMRDLIGLGDQDGFAHEAPMTPTAFATASFWRMLAHKRMPFAYLGAIYLFEGLTPLVTAAVKPRLLSQGFDARSLEYIEFHATEDVRHTRIVDSLVSDLIDAYPDRAADVVFGFEAFRAVYPLPGWKSAYARASLSVQDSTDCP